jgi:putative ABC transport system permease protein
MVKNNPSSGMSVRIAAFISALLLSLLTGVFYNLWKYEVERIILEEGDWQSRIVGEFDEEDLEHIRSFAHVKDVVVNEKINSKDSKKGRYNKDGGEKKEGRQDGEGEEVVVDIYFSRYRAVFSDMPKIAESMNIAPEKISYHYELLAMYLVRDSSDPKPRLLFPLFVLIMAIASFSLIMVIHNAFAITMKMRIHQLGIFSSIGAAPRQIKSFLLQEAAVLCAVPVLAGKLLGIAFSMGLIQLLNILLGKDVPGRHASVFGYHPLVFGISLAAVVITLWVSAWLPARKLSRLSPLEAIKNTGEVHLKRKKNSRILRLFFGVEGELAGNTLKAQRKALGTASLSLVFSLLAFTIMQCFFTLSEISTRETYFARYQDAWDIMVEVKDADVENFAQIREIQGLSEVESAAVYQKAAAKTVVLEEEISEEMKAFGGFSHASVQQAVKTDVGWMVNAPLVILDDESFLAYCEQIHIPVQLCGAVVRNQIRDVTNPDFRHPVEMPYVKGEKDICILHKSGDEKQAAEIPVLAYTNQVPVLREEYASLDAYELVHFLPASLWKEIKEKIGGWEEDSYIRVLGKNHESLKELDLLQNRIEEIIGPDYRTESENRIREFEANARIIWGMKVIFGGFCVLLAMIGVGNVFSYTLGFVRQRRREFARYLSIGMTFKELRKMFCVEALVIAGRPLVLTLPPGMIAVWYMLKMSYLGTEEFLSEAPVLPIAVFILAISGFVALAYYLGWRVMGRVDLAEVLKDDTMM